MNKENQIICADIFNTMHKLLRENSEIVERRLSYYGHEVVLKIGDKLIVRYHEGNKTMKVNRQVHDKEAINITKGNVPWLRPVEFLGCYVYEDSLAQTKIKKPFWKSFDKAMKKPLLWIQTDKEAEETIKNFLQQQKVC